MELICSPVRRAEPSWGSPAEPDGLLEAMPTIIGVVVRCRVVHSTRDFPLARSNTRTEQGPEDDHAEPEGRSERPGRRAPPEDDAEAHQVEHDGPPDLVKGFPKWLGSSHFARYATAS